jgi:hypothetical protein
MTHLNQPLATLGGMDPGSLRTGGAQQQADGGSLCPSPGAVADVRPPAFVVQCAWCRKVDVNQEFVHASPVPWVKVSHVICPECYFIQIEDLMELGCEVRGPGLVITHDPEVAAQLIEKEKAA